MQTEWQVCKSTMGEPDHSDDRSTSSRYRRTCRWCMICGRDLATIKAYIKVTSARTSRAELCSLLKDIVGEDVEKNSSEYLCGRCHANTVNIKTKTQLIEKLRREIRDGYNRTKAKAKGWHLAVTRQTSSPVAVSVKTSQKPEKVASPGTPTSKPKTMADLDPSLGGNSTPVTVRIKEEYEAFSDDGKELPEKPLALVDTLHQPGQSWTIYEVKRERVEPEDTLSACEKEEVSMQISVHEDYDNDVLGTTLTREDLSGSLISPDTLNSALPEDDKSQVVDFYADPAEWNCGEETLSEPQSVNEDMMQVEELANPIDLDYGEDTESKESNLDKSDEKQVRNANPEADMNGWDIGDNVRIEAQCVDEDTKTQVLDANPKDWDNGDDILIEAQCVNEDNKTQVQDANPDADGWDNDDDIRIKAQCVDEDTNTQVQDANPDADGCRWDNGDDILIEAQCVDENDKTQVQDVNPDADSWDNGDDIPIVTQCVDEDKTQALDANPAELEDTSRSKALNGHSQNSNLDGNGCRQEQIGENLFLKENRIKERDEESMLKQSVLRTDLASEPTSTGTGPADIFNATPGLPTDETISATPATAEDSGLDKHQCKECGNQFSQPIFLACHLKFSHGYIGLAPTRDTPKSDKFDLIKSERVAYGFLHKDRNNTDISSCKRSTDYGKACDSSDHLTNKQSHNSWEPCACYQCEKAFNEAGHFTRYKCTSVDEKLIECNPICGKAFSRNKNPRTHKQINTNEKTFVCDQCGKAFRRKINLKIHKLIHTGEKPYVCDRCGKAFNRASHLKSHERIHTGENPYVCDQCGKAFNKLYTLTRHRLIHTGEKPYICDQCGKSFTRESNLTTHKQIHTGEKPHTCIQCGKAFHTVARLTRHIKCVHKGEKSKTFVGLCDQCGKGFNSVHHLADHKRIHTGEKPYVCDHCGKAFSREDVLIGHKRIHTGEKPYVCDHCDKAFNKLYTLTRHKRIHTGEKPFACDQCGKAFLRKTTLITHKQIHTGEKHYACDQCGMVFSKAGNLTKHKQIHTTGEKP